MKMEITTKNYRVSDRLEHILSTKLKKLDKYFPDKDTPCKVVLTDLGRQCQVLPRQGHSLQGSAYRLGQTVSSTSPTRTLPAR